MATIIFNGKSYNGIEEMPAKEKQAYEQMMEIFVDKNGNGVPDFMEGDILQKMFAINSTSMDVNGQTVKSLDDLSPEARQRVDKALQALTKIGFIPGVPAELQTQNQPISREPEIQSTPFISKEYAPVIQEENSPSIFPMVIAGIILLFLLAVSGFGIVYFITR